MHRYILRVTPVLPKFEAKSTHAPKPCQNGPSAASAHAFRFRPPPLPSHQSRRASAVTNPKSAPPPAPRNSSAPANFPEFSKKNQEISKVWCIPQTNDNVYTSARKILKTRGVYQKVNVAPWCIPPKCETLARFYYTPPTKSRKTQNFNFFRVFGPGIFSKLAPLGQGRYIPFLTYCLPGMLREADFRYTTILAASLPSALEALTSEAMTVEQKNCASKKAFETK